MQNYLICQGAITKLQLYFLPFYPCSLTSQKIESDRLYWYTLLSEEFGNGYNEEAQSLILCG